jgi:hypothetical protein
LDFRVDSLCRKNGEQCATTGEWMAKKAPALVRIEALLKVVSHHFVDYPVF